MWRGPQNHGSQEKDGEKEGQEKDRKEASEESRQAVAEEKASEKEVSKKEASRQENAKTSCEEIASELGPSGVGSTDVQFGGAIRNSVWPRRCSLAATARVGPWQEGIHRYRPRCTWRRNCDAHRGELRKSRCTNTRV